MGMRNVRTISRGWFCDHHCHNFLLLLFSNALTDKLRNLILFVLFMPLAVGPGAVRLVNGTLSSGKVQIFYDQKWGTICDESWDITDANVVCRQLGFSGADHSVSSSYESLQAGHVWINKVNCSGRESLLYNCKHSGWRTSDCSHNRMAGVSCSVVRLVDGGERFGLLEVYYGGQWGTVCDNVVSGQLGFSNAASFSSGSEYGVGSGQVWMAEVKCHGDEHSLLDCPHAGWGMHTCTHSKDVNVECV